MGNELLRSKERILAVDALRGFAVMGIILLHNIEHFNYYSFPEAGSSLLSSLDKHLWDMLFFLFSGKAYAIFALLFGFTFYLQSHNCEKRGEDFRNRYMWRLVLLLGFGFINASFFPGENIPRSDIRSNNAPADSGVDSFSMNDARFPSENRPRPTNPSNNLPAYAVSNAGSSGLLPFPSIFSLVSSFESYNKSSSDALVPRPGAPVSVVSLNGLYPPSSICRCMISSYASIAASPPGLPRR